MPTRPSTADDRFVHAFVSIALVLIGALFFMLLVGVIHHEWIAELPTIGYGWSLVIIALARVVTAALMYRVHVALDD